MVDRLARKALENIGGWRVVSTASSVHQIVVVASAVGGWWGVAVGVVRGIVLPQLWIKVHSICVPWR